MLRSLQVSIGAVSERDIDLLLVEEFASSPDFVRWFLGRVDAAARSRFRGSRSFARRMSLPVRPRRSTSAFSGAWSC